MLRIFCCKNTYGIPSMPGTSKNEFPNTMNKVINGYSLNLGTITIQIKQGLAVATCSNVNGLMPGMVIRIAGATPGALNADWKIEDVIGTTYFTFPTTVDGTVTGTITVSVPGESSIVVTNPLTDTYYYNIGGKYLKVVIPSLRNANFYMTDSTADANITPAIPVNTVASNFIIMTNDDLLYFFGSGGLYMFGKIDSLLESDTHNWIIGLLGDTNYLSRSYTGTGGYIAANTKPFITQSSILKTPAANFNISPAPIAKITVWEGNSALRGHLRGVRDCWGNLASRVNFAMYNTVPDRFVYWASGSKPAMIMIDGW